MNWLYVIRDCKLVGLLGAIDGEIGGPIFRDLDHDGRPEMIFDNDSFFEFGDNGPTAYQVFKVAKNYKITFWKELPNPRRKRLRHRLPYF